MSDNNGRSHQHSHGTSSNEIICGGTCLIGPRKGIFAPLVVIFVIVGGIIGNIILLTAINLTVVP